VSFQLIYSESYLKRAKRFAKQHPDLKEQYRKALRLIEQNPFHPSLRILPLQGRLTGLHSVSINISYRISLEMFITENEIVLVNVGSHQDVYK
jgi:addiction module RelE/StbE family toxin